MTPAERVTRDALVDTLEFELGVVESGVARWAVDPLDGPQVTFLNIPSFQPLATAEDGEALLARWREMGPWIDRHVAGLRAAARDGLVAPRALVDSVVAELDDLLARPDDAWPLARPSAADRPGWSGTERDRFAAAIGAAIRDDIRPAFERQRAYLADELASIARPDDRAGLGHVPGGEAAYAHLVAAHTTVDLDPSAIHAIGLEEVDRIDAEFAELGGRLLGTSTTAETLDRLRLDPSLRFTTRDEVRETAEASLRRANEAIPAWFGRLPVAPCEVVVMGDHESAHSTIAYYRQPAADGSRPGSYYVNTTLPETRPRYEAEALAFHEAVPGHHLQLAIAQELDHLPAFRRFGGPTAFVGGLGPVHGAPGGRDGPLLRAARPVRRPVVRRVAGVPARRRHRDARAGLEPRPGDRLHARPYRAGREQRRQRGRALPRAAGPGAGVQDRPARVPRAPGGGRSRARRARSTSGRSTTPRWARAPSGCGRSAASSRPGSRGRPPDVGPTGARRRRGQCENEWSTFRRRSTRQCRTLCSIDG